MKLGIDFGTTRIVVAAADRGNYPVVGFETPEGAKEEWYPPLAALRGEERVYGWEAYARQADPEWTVVRSLKRLLSEAGPNTLVTIGDGSIPLMSLLRGLVHALKHDLLERSTLGAEGRMEVMLGVPANANGNQRFLTAAAFREAGFDVVGMLNEPSAASIEFGHRNKTQFKDKQRILVYDLGGGTFDASLVEYDDRTHTVLASESIATLGGDDFDHLLADLALRAGGLAADELTASEHFRLLEECRLKKEALHPNTRKIALDLGVVREEFPAFAIAIGEYYEAASAYVQETLHAVLDLLKKSGDREIDLLYVTGGGSELPLVARVLKEEFGRRVKRSAYTRSATAIGLAIQADTSSGYELREQFTRYFGVWREADGGRRIVFDPLFPKGTALPAPSIIRQYSPIHNIGHFRYLECSYVNEAGQPAGDITIWDEILFPLDPDLETRADLSGIAVEYNANAARQHIEEEYGCDASGQVSVTIRNLTSGHTRTWPLGRWSVKSAPVTPQRKRRAARGA